PARAARATRSAPPRRAPSGPTGTFASSRSTSNRHTPEASPLNHLGSLLLILVGIVLLAGGAEVLVRGASRLAARVGIPPLIVGLTVVAFGTSSPEIAVSLGS